MSSVHNNLPIRIYQATSNQVLDIRHVLRPIESKFKCSTNQKTIKLLVIPSLRSLHCLTSLITTSITLHVMPDQRTRVHIIEG